MLVASSQPLATEIAAAACNNPAVQVAYNTALKVADRIRVAIDFDFDLNRDEVKAENARPHVLAAATGRLPSDAAFAGIAFDRTAVDAPVRMLESPHIARSRSLVGTTSSPGERRVMGALSRASRGRSFHLDFSLK